MRKATISFVVSVRLSVCMEQLGSYRTDFEESWYSGFFFLKPLDKMQVLLKSYKNQVHFT
jgi:hypothetical protein